MSSDKQREIKSDYIIIRGCVAFPDNFYMGYEIMSRNIGRIIQELREKAGYTQKELCRGVCTISELAKIETDRVIPGNFELDRLFGRLGESTERLEYVLTKEVYRLYELQYRIQVNILKHNYDEAEKLLNDYESMKKADTPIHEQFIIQERAQIAWLRGKTEKVVLAYLNAAISQTIQEEVSYGEAVTLNNVLCAEELKLLLFRWEVSQEGESRRTTEELDSILDYILHKHMDDAERVKVYPYAVLLRVNVGDVEKEYEYLVWLLKTALKLLREQSRLLYMDEIMEIYVTVFSEKGDSKELEWMKRVREMLLQVEREFGIDYRKYRLFQHMNRTFELDYEIIRNSRIACDLSQEALSGYICTRETLSRIESGQRNPSNKNLEKLLNCMKRERERINTVIATEKYETIKLKKDIAVYLHEREYDKAEEILEQLENIIDMNIPINRQYIEAEKIRIKMRNGQIRQEYAMKNLEEILHLTLDWSEGEEIKFQLTVTESDILNQIAILCCTKENIEAERGVQIWEKILKNYERSLICPAFRIRQWDLYAGNLAIAFENSGRFEDSAYWSEKVIAAALTLGKGSMIGSALDTIACTLEKQKDVKCLQRFEQTYCFYELFYLEKRCRMLKEYMEKSEFLKLIK